jgi:hypothetical protein
MFIPVGDSHQGRGTPWERVRIGFIADAVIALHR